LSLNVYRCAAAETRQSVGFVLFFCAIAEDGDGALETILFAAYKMKKRISKKIRIA
jgi:hypothetical protein